MTFEFSVTELSTVSSSFHQTEPKISNFSPAVMAKLMAGTTVMVMDFLLQTSALENTNVEETFRQMVMSVARYLPQEKPALASNCHDEVKIIL